MSHIAGATLGNEAGPLAPRAAAVRLVLVLRQAGQEEAIREEALSGQHGAESTMLNKHSVKNKRLSLQLQKLCILKQEYTNMVIAKIFIFPLLQSHLEQIITICLINLLVRSTLVSYAFGSFKFTGHRCVTTLGNCCFQSGEGQNLNSSLIVSGNCDYRTHFQGKNARLLNDHAMISAKRCLFVF